MPTVAGKAVITFEGDYSKVQQGARNVTGAVGSAMRSGLGGVFGSIGRLGVEAGRAASVAFVGASLVAAKFLQVAISSAQRVQAQQLAMNAIAKATGHTASQLDITAASVHALGIEESDAISLTTALARQHLNLADAAKLGAIAQNASVVTGKSVADTLAGIVKGIATSQPRILKNIGLYVDTVAAQKQWSKQNGIAVKDMTAQQKSQATLNAVLASGASIQGVYAASLSSSSVQMKVLPQYLQDIAVTVGNAFLPVWNILTTAVFKLVVGFDKAITQNPALHKLLTALAADAGKLVKPLGGMVDHLTQFLTHISNAQVDHLLGTMSKLVPLMLPLFAGLGAAGLHNLPIIGSFLPALNPFIAGLVVLGAQSPALREFFKQFGKTMANDLRGIAPQLNGLWSALQAGILQVLPAFGKIIGALITAGGQLIPALTPLIPIIATVAGQILNDLAWAIGQLAPVIGPLLPVVGHLATDIGKLLHDAIKIVVPLVADLVAYFGPTAGMLLDGMVKIADFILGGLKKAFTFLSDHLGGKAGMNAIVGVLVGLFVAWQAVVKTSAIINFLIALGSKEIIGGMTLFGTASSAALSPYLLLAAAIPAIFAFLNYVNPLKNRDYSSFPWLDKNGNLKPGWKIDSRGKFTEIPSFGRTTSKAPGTAVGGDTPPFGLHWVGEGGAELHQEGPLGGHTYSHADSLRMTQGQGRSISVSVVAQTNADSVQIARDVAWEMRRMAVA